MFTPFMSALASLRFALFYLCLGLSLGLPTAAHARGEAPPPGPPSVAFNALPIQAQTTIALIAAGGPFPYKRDGITFQNREQLLPYQSRGYYREYTVPTPGSRDRGARRIVAGVPGELYYTADHYRSFRRVKPLPTEFAPPAARSK